MPDAETNKRDLTGGTSVLGEEAAAAAGSETPAQEAAPEIEAEGTPVTGRSDRLAGVRSEAEGLRAEATERFYAFAGSGKDSAVEFIDSYVQTIQDAAVKVEEFAGPQVAQYVHQVADMANDFTETLRNSDVDELIDEARNLVRRSPALAIGAAAAIGFALSRFLKATSERLEPEFTPKARNGATGRAQAYDA